MTAPRRSKVEIFNAAADLPGEAERAAFLDRACAGDGALRAEIEDLLRHDAEAKGFLQSGAVAFPAPEPPLESAGATIGPYKLLEQIGEGGFGVVFMAEQAQPVRRRVALKVLKPGMDTKQVIARFEAERQALALMDHPNIAKVLEAGTTGTGRPYFVMELVRGVPITDYCDAQHLTPRERLELFVTVCQAVQHAHQKGIIHRDLKPSNVLVTLHDDGPVAKVIDFGIAKATSGQLTERTLFTGFAQMIGTPLYMSPEQAFMSAIDVDTRSDVYSLGVLLYELLTGTTPFDKVRLKDAAFDEVRRIIREEEPAKPSTRLSTDQTLPKVAANRGTEPANLTRLLRGELDWIVMKALEKDRSRRYETASGFAADVRRYLADEPVSACPPSMAYRLRKLARRNKGALATVALLGAMLLVVAGSFGWMASERAARHGRDAEAVAVLLLQCERALAEDAADQAAIALDAAGQRVADGGAEGLRGRWMRNRADLALLRELDAVDAYRWTWINDAPPSREALEARRQAALARYGVTPDEAQRGEAVARVRGSLVRDRLLTALDRSLALGNTAGVRELLRAADPDPYRDAVRDAVLARDARALIALAERPEALVQPAWFASLLGVLPPVPIERRRAVMETALRSRPGDLVLLMELANSYAADSEATRRERGPCDPQALAERVRWCQAAVATHPRNVPALNNLGVALWERGDLAAALACYEEVVRIDPTFARGHYNKGVIFEKQGHPADATASYRESIRLNPKGVDARYNLAQMLINSGDAAGAIPHLEEAIRVGPTDVHLFHYLLGLARHTMGDVAGAMASYRMALAAQPDDPESHCNLGHLLRDLGQLPEALKHLRRGNELGRRRPNWRYPSDVWVAETERLIELEARLPQALAGEPTRPAELVELADLCLRRKRNADAALLFGRAFAAEPSIAEEPNSHRYNAVCAAALASGAAAVEASDKTALREQALRWLLAELAVHRRALAHDPAATAPVEDLEHWLNDPDLGAVREERELAAMPEAERERWTELWNEVRDLMSRKAKN